MKKLTVQKSVFSMVLMAAGIAGAQVPIAPQGFCDSTCGSGALRGTPKIPLKYQELQEMGSPIVNSVTNVTQVVQPQTYQVTNSAYGQTTAGASVDCGGGTLTGGGGTCNDNSGLVAVAASQPNGNGWYVGCQSLNYQGVTATVYAVCSGN